MTTLTRLSALVRIKNNFATAKKNFTTVLINERFAIRNECNTSCFRCMYYKNNFFQTLADILYKFCSLTPLLCSGRNKYHFNPWTIILTVLRMKHLMTWHILLWFILLQISLFNSDIMFLFNVLTRTHLSFVLLTKMSGIFCSFDVFS